MPIFEFKCSECEEFFEVLVMGKSEEKDDTVKCPKCESTEFERVLSSTNHKIAGGGASAGPGGSGIKERSCSSGSCSTYTIPGQ